MSLQAIIGGRQMDVFAFSLDFKDAKLPEFKVKIESYPFADYEALLYQDIAILRNGQEMVSGLVAQNPRPARHLGRYGFLQLVCDTQLGRLHREMALSVQFQNATIAVALSSLLAAAEDSLWALNSTISLDDANITIDVRQKETLWSQIEAVRKAAKTPFNLRYAGYSSPHHLLDIGSFGEQVRDVFAIEGQNIMGEPKYSQPSRDPLLEIRPISGKVGNKPVKLSEALLLEPLLATDPDYPLDVSRETVVNNVISSGRRIKRIYTEIKTENKRLPTQVQRSEAALALYYRTRRDLMSSQSYKVLRLDVALDVMPQLYTKIYVDVLARQVVYDEYREVEEEYELLPIQGWFNVTGFALRGDMLKGSLNELTGKLLTKDVYSIDLSSGQEEEEYNEVDFMFSKLEQNDLEDNTGLVIGILLQVPVIVNHSAAAADCAYSGPNTGKLFEFPLPIIPDEATAISTEVKTVSVAGVDWVVVQDASLLLPLKLCVSGAGGANWTALDSVTIEIWYSFT